jgi:hypothetical protein
MNFVLLIYSFLVGIGSRGETEGGEAHVGRVHAEQEYEIA